MKHIVLALHFLFFVFLVSGQGSISFTDKVIEYHIPQDTALQKRLAGSEGFNSLSADEREVAYYLNYARFHPREFLQFAINPFVDGHPEVVSKYTRSLQETLGKVSPLPFIQPDAVISGVARAHAMDLRKHHVLSHQSTNGKTFQDRMKSFAKGCASECIHAAQRFTALEAVMGLLFDFNVPTLGHRETLLNPSLHRGGFGISVDPQVSTVLVIDFSCE